MDRETVLQWFCSNIDFRVIRVRKQHRYKSKYSYLDHPRPDFGLMLLVSGKVDFYSEHIPVWHQNNTQKAKEYKTKATSNRIWNDIAFSLFHASRIYDAFAAIGIFAALSIFSIIKRSESASSLVSE